MPEKVLVCVRVVASSRDRIVRIEPQDLLLAPGEQQPVRAIAEQVDEAEAPLDGTERTLEFDEVTFRPAEPSPERPEEDLEGVFSVVRDYLRKEWRVEGRKEGSLRRLQASVTTEGPGNAVLPSRAIGFFLPGGDADPEVVDKDAFADVDTVGAPVTGEVIVRGELVIGDGTNGKTIPALEAPTLSFSKADREPANDGERVWFYRSGSGSNMLVESLALDPAKPTFDVRIPVKGATPTSCSSKATSSSVRNGRVQVQSKRPRAPACRWCRRRKDPTAS